MGFAASAIWEEEWSAKSQWAEGTSEELGSPVPHQPRSEVA